MAVVAAEITNAPNLGQQLEEDQASSKKKATNGKGAEKADKSKKQKVFINDEIFGKSKTLADVPPEEGIAHLKIKVHESGHIPGLIEHWNAEVEKRKKAITEWKQKSFIQRAAGVLSRKGIPDDVSGKELERLHPTKPAVNILKNLKQDPMDMMSRLELIRIVATSGRDLSLEVYRLLFLHSVVACSFGELSNVGLQNVLWIQDIYFNKFYNKCKHEYRHFSDKSKTDFSQTEENVYTKQASLIRGHMANISRNMDIIKGFQKQTTRALKEANSAYVVALNLNEITEFLIAEDKDQKDSKRDEKKQSLIKKASELLLLVRAVPLLNDQAEELSNAIKKIDPEDPVVHFLHAKVNMSDLVFKVTEYQSGIRTDSLRKDIQKTFQSTYKHYGLAVKKVGKMPKTKIEFAILIEYANLVHYFYKVAKNTLGLHLPKEWLATVLNKALNLLQLVQETGQVDGLISDIQKAMVAEGIRE